jgi:hypothetical protein
MTTLSQRSAFSILFSLVASAASGCSAHGSHEDLGALDQALDEVPVLGARVDTVPLPGYDDAPRTPSADDPAIWVNRRDPSKSLVLGTLKDAGLQVYDLAGRVVQTVLPRIDCPFLRTIRRPPELSPTPGPDHARRASRARRSADSTMWT